VLFGFIYLLCISRSGLLLTTFSAVVTADQLELFMQGKEKAILEEIDNAGQIVLYTR